MERAWHVVVASASHACLGSGFHRGEQIKTEPLAGGVAVLASYLRRFWCTDLTFAIACAYTLLVRAVVGSTAMHTYSAANALLAPAHTHTHIRTYTCTYIHTHTHTKIYIYTHRHVLIMLSKYGFVV